MDFIVQVVNGLGMGSIYALVALGYSMVYGIVQLINFAHGDIIMVAAYIIFISMMMMGLPLWAAILLCVVLSALVGMPPPAGAKCA